MKLLVLARGILKRRLGPGGDILMGDLQQTTDYGQLVGSNILALCLKL